MDIPPSKIAKRAAWDMDSRASVECRVVQQLHPVVVDRLNPPAYDRVEDHYIETAKGSRFREIQYIDSGTGKVSLREQRYFRDGKAADVGFNQTQPEDQTHILIKRWFGNENQSERTERPKPILFGYVGRLPLAEALPKGEVVGKDKVVGRDVTTLLFRQAKWGVPQDLCYGVDDEAGVTLKVASYANDEARGKDRPQWVWTADETTTVGERTVVAKSSQIEYNPEGAEKFRRTFEVTSIAFDKTYPASTFWPVYQPGVKILDAIAKREYDAPGKRKTAAPPSAPETASVAQPLQAVPPASWSDYASSAAIGLGLAALAVGTFLTLRRR